MFLKILFLSLFVNVFCEEVCPVQKIGYSNEITFLPAVTIRGNWKKQCSWIINVPETDPNYILVIVFKKLTGYQSDDQILLPDKSRLTTKTINSDRRSVCYSFAFIQSKKNPCVQKLARTFCPNQPLRELVAPITLSILTTRDKDGNPHFNFFTQFKLEYSFEYCPRQVEEQIHKAPFYNQPKPIEKQKFEETLVLPSADNGDDPVQTANIVIGVFLTFSIIAIAVLVFVLKYRNSIKEDGLFGAIVRNFIVKDFVPTEPPK